MIAWLAAAALMPISSATTIVTLINDHGIVICADGKVTQVSSKSTPETPASDAGSGEKIFVIQNRFVIEHAGIKSFDATLAANGERIVIPYSTDRVVSEIRRDASPMFTLSKVSGILRDKLIEEFVGFDILPQSGGLRPEHLQPPTHRVLTEFNVVGYDRDGAHVYSIGVEMDWSALVHRVSQVAAVYPQPQRPRYLGVSISGHNDAIMELYKTTNPSAKQFAANWPVEYAGLGNQRDLDIDRMVTLARALLRVQIARTPNDVGYPLRIIVIPKDGGMIKDHLYRQ